MPTAGPSPRRATGTTKAPRFVLACRFATRRKSPAFRPKKIPGRVPAREKILDAPAIHLLLVEDHADTAPRHGPNARALRLSRDRGLMHRAEGCAETAAAHETVDDNGRTLPIRLVISDLGLPDGSGTELMRRNSPRNTTLPASPSADFGMEDDVRRAEAAGFWRHLTKPVDFGASPRQYP